ncbi:YeiH family protein [Desulfurispora thermophila]|uniref:YeiH family protein n=1 Tax=Desulfurispora thermophila TaxID=265470 RepID=UPI0003786B7B|nr:putative sulfate exporter family transporter [Desulfurispora thermophila]
MQHTRASFIFKTIPGILLMFAIALFTMGGQDIGIPWPGIEAYLRSNPLTQKILVDILRLNYILLSIIIGMLIGNLFTLPDWILAGVSTSRLFIKLGVILLGSLYSFTDVAQLGVTAILLVLTFIVLTLVFTLWLGKKTGMDPASAAVLAAGTAVCGISAIIATAPAVRARTTDVVFSIATILSFGVASIFLFPVVGNLLNLSAHQFGVWSGTGILSSGQVLAACLIYDPGTANHASVSLKTGEIYNLTRVLFLPFVVLALAVLNSRSARLPDEHITVHASLWSKFPVFVLGFLIMVFLTSLGLLGPTSPPSPELITIRKLYNWFFAIGLTGLGMQISFSELRRAGGKPLLVGSAAALFKAVLALIVVLLFVPEKP